MADSAPDIVSKVDPMELQHAVNQAQKELSQRYTLCAVEPEITLRNGTVSLFATSDERVKALLAVLQSKLVQRGISAISLDLSEQVLQGKRPRIDGKLKNGISIQSESTPQAAR